MIVHIATDEKFIDSGIFQFEQAFPKQNKYFVIQKSECELKFVKSKNKNITVLQDADSSIDTLINEFRITDLVVLHGLDYFKSKLVLKADKAIRFFLLFWGTEVYQYHKKFKYRIYGVETFKNFFPSKLELILKDIFRNFYYRIKFKSISPNKAILKALFRIDYFGSGLKKEYDFLVDNKIISAEYVKFLYYPIEYILKDSFEKTINSNNIPIGNSASPSNNHLEMFDYFKRINIKNKQVYIPLSYGEKGYAHNISKDSKKAFGDNSIALLDFLPISEYNKIQESCRYVVFNHYRQQGMGNIVISLWLGAKVFLSERNILLRCFRDLGITIFNISELEKQLLIDQPLEEMYIQSNRKILLAEFGSKTLESSLKLELKNILNES